MARGRRGGPEETCSEVLTSADIPGAYSECKVLGIQLGLYHV